MISSYSTSVMVPVSSSMALMRMPVWCASDVEEIEEEKGSKLTIYGLGNCRCKK